MKQSFIILTFLISFSVTSEPWDKLVNELTSRRTLTELKIAKSKLYSRQNRTPLTRSLDFGFKYTVWDFDLVHENYSADFKLHIITRNDSIIFGNLERVHWKGRTAEDIEFSVNEAKLRDLVHKHNVFYTTSYSVDGFVDYLTNDYYFSLGCGETASDLPKEAEQMQRWAKLKNIKKLSKWLCSPNYELQAYSIEGLTRIKESGESIPEYLEDIIQHLRDRNSIVVNCSGCLMGLETPLNKLLFEYRK